MDKAPDRAGAERRARRAEAQALRDKLAAALTRLG